MKKNFHLSVKSKLFAFVLLLQFASLRPFAQTTLVQGDISIVAINANSGAARGLCFVTWVNMSTSTEVRFTDNGFNNVAASTSTNNMRWQETILIWTATAAVPAGTVICIEGEAVNIGSANVINASLGADPPVTVLNLPNTSGDQVFAYQGANMPTTTTASAGSNALTFNNTILFGIGYQGSTSVNTTWLPAGPAGSFTSCLPTDLVSPNRIYHAGNTVGAQFAGARTGSATAASYRAAIENTANWTQYTSGTFTNNTTAFQLGTPPAITGNPGNSTICAGNNTSFSVTASNPVSYQWQVNSGAGYANVSNGGVYSNATTATLNITGATAGMNGYMYRCIVTGSASPAATSTGASITVNSAPAITAQPPAASICASGNTSFSVTASNATGYQWQQNTGSGYSNVTNGGVFSGATTSTLSITGATAGMNGYMYRVIISGACTPAATSSGAALTVNASPVITTNPSPSSVCAGSGTLFYITANSATSYQWQVNSGSGYTNITNGAGPTGGTYSGATSSVLIINSAATAMSGYTYRCIVGGSCSPGGTSTGASLTILANIWSGSSNTLWSNTANWSCGVLPTATTNVTIPAGASNMPVVDIADATCNDLTISAGATLTINAGNALDIKGAVNNNGTFTVPGKAGFSGASQTIPAGTYADLEISGSGTKSLAGAITISGVLTLTSSYIQLDASDISITSSGSISGGSPSSFIVINGAGSLKQDNIGAGGRTGLILFPVGVSTSSYTPAGVNNTAGTSDAFSVRVIAGVNGAYDENDVAVGAAQTTFNVNNTWLISEGTPGGSNATLSFQWNASDEQPSFNPNNCFGRHYTGGMWQRDPLGQIASGADPYTISLGNVTSFSPFGIGSVGSTLPVTLHFFSGKAVPAGIHLQWQTDNEWNSSHFDIQRSTDGNNYVSLGKISAVNRPGVHGYSFTDPFVNSKTKYYRLKQVDIDGKFIYSAVLVFTGEQKEEAVLVYPNPFVNQANLTIRLSQSAKISFSIVDNNGKLVRKWQQDMQAGIITMGIDLEGLAPGLYYLEIKGLNSPRHIKLIKQ